MNNKKNNFNRTLHKYNIYKKKSLDTILKRDIFYERYILYLP